jgi:hypothetical protein
VTLKERLAATQDAMLDLVQKWWRPAAQWSVAGGTFVNLVYLPLKTGKSPSLAEAAAYLTALGTLFAVRAYEKVKGAA